MNSEQIGSSLSTPEIPPCDHQRKIESIQEIIFELDWKINQLSLSLEEMEYELRLEPEFFGKWSGHAELFEEMRVAELEMTTCHEIVAKEEKTASEENCFCLLI